MFTMTKTMAALAGLATAASLTALPSAPAAASEDPALASARGFLSEYGASQATQDRLIETYLAGETWDSLSSSSKPVTVDERSAADGEYTVSTYEDGSIAVTRLETPTAEGPRAGRGISGCSVSGRTYSNCKIDTWVGVVQLAFRASYNLGTNQVTNAYGYEYTIIGACGASPSLARPAGNIARLSINAQMCAMPL
ncbi:hypothetical protein O159_11890 [Leifsonia xyli subsp. cynodontis DSM 46306]|uniref:Secreted protein n=1 Tax=Leifsonia xyli subsp. cynodontis DSM 46306 TaxID=1389489 RepID=U3P738_LEIXC|nr:hypothetical protein [Leifsonia xyli]AGW41274.1 hypothetical protein O159_11890 [Leifsonia xyli subsp. cynodontis DSM 46306]